MARPYVTINPAIVRTLDRFSTSRRRFLARRIMTEFANYLASATSPEATTYRQRMRARL
ncbi:MAG TPA: hypothetical protein PKI03_35720 [Pseudomonadota bacterium]|nr:hypothetical protein [Pseudomonadota bacterium]